MRTNILRARKALLVLFAMMMPLLASAHDFEVDGIYYNITSEENKTVEVTFRGDDRDSYANEYAGSIIIPSTVTYEGLQYSVTTIGEWAFRGCTALHSITISEGIISISEDAFNSCCFLHSVSIPASVEKVSERTFILCSKLTTINIDNKNPVYSDEEDNAIVEKSTKTLIAGTTVGIPAGIDSIANFAFCGRSFSAQDVIIPEGVTAIGRYAFIECTANRIHIPSTLKKIDMQAFLCLDYATYIEEIHIKDLSAWLDIDFGHFESNPLLSEANLYLNGELLDTIITPQNISAIKKYAFAGWSGKEIIITENVKHIESYVFVDCPKLTDVYCYAENVPNTDTRAFRRFNIEKATLYVPASAIESYKSTVPWSSFGKIESIKTSVSAITFNHPSVILVEGGSISLTATISPDDATDSSVTWSSSNEDVAMVSSKGKVVALVAGTATITATANDGSGVSASCEIIVKAPLLGKCATPTINYIDGEFVLTCSTEGAEIKTIVVTENDNEFVGEKFDFLPTHTFTAYATKENYEDSDVAALTLCWIPCSEEHHSEETDVLTIPSKPVLISARDGVLTLSGLAEGTEVALYTTDGIMVTQQQSSAGEAQFTVSTNQIYLVHIGDKVVKIGM